MIRLIQKEEIASLLPFLEQDALGCRIGSALLCYQRTPFLDVWVQEEVSGIQAVLCRLDGAMTILDTGKADRLEQKAFCHAVGFSSLTASSYAVTGLGLTPLASGMAMRFSSPSDKPTEDGAFGCTDPPGQCFPSIYWGGSPRLYYPILEQCQGDGIQLPPFDTWYVDCSHRMRRGWMRGGIVKQAEENIGCILAVETPHTALITGVAVAPAFQKQGIGKRMVEAFAAVLSAEGKTCFLLCRDPLTGFYHSLGFQAAGRWAVVSSPSKEAFL